MPNQFILIEPDPVVALDLNGLLSSRYPDAVKVSGGTFADVAKAFQMCGPRTTVFARATLVASDNDLHDAVMAAATRGSHIVLIGAEQKTSFPAVFVDLPFTNDMLVAAIDPSFEAVHKGDP
ncbi:hypothetical protein AB3Y40_12120 [Yoonia sp. R2331]|uniref:hypothetical protein n=1 Tax=Yoonia sp. R2331 TaxID=3237238 RepID=UPI0034E41927